jgi:putative phosphoesterase
MTKIGLLSDTHHYLDDKIFRHFEACDEIWHAGDFGTIKLAEQLSAFRPLKGVYGNIDGNDVRSVYPEALHWKCEEVTVFMQHIGGYPGRYVPSVREYLKANPVQLFISGHSHILKIMFDEKFSCLHMNPGAAGKEGWHKVRTLVTFSIDKEKILNCSVIELGNR